MHHAKDTFPYSWSCGCSKTAVEIIQQGLSYSQENTNKLSNSVYLRLNGIFVSFILTQCF